MSNDTYIHVGWYLVGQRSKVDIKRTITSCPTKHHMNHATAKFCQLCGEQLAERVENEVGYRNVQDILNGDTDETPWIKDLTKGQHQWIEKNVGGRVLYHDSDDESDVIGFGGFTYVQGGYEEHPLKMKKINNPPSESTINKLVGIMKYSSYKLKFGMVISDC